MASQISAQSGDSGVSGCRSEGSDFVVTTNSVEVVDDRGWNNPTNCTNKEQTEKFECFRHSTNISNEQSEAGSSIEKSQKRNSVSKPSWDEDESHLSIMPSEYEEEWKDRFNMHFNLMPALRRLAQPHRKHEECIASPAESSSPCTELSPNVVLPSYPFLACEASRHPALGGYQSLVDALSKSTNKENLPASFLSMAPNISKKHFPNGEYSCLRQESSNSEMGKDSSFHHSDSQQKLEDPSSPSHSFSVPCAKNCTPDVQVSKSNQESSKPELPQHDNSITHSTFNATYNSDLDSTIIYVDSDSSSNSGTMVEKTLDLDILDDSSACRREFVDQYLNSSMLGPCSPIRPDLSVRRTSIRRQFNADLNRTAEDIESVDKTPCDRMNNSAATNGIPCSSPLPASSGNPTLDNSYRRVLWNPHYSFISSPSRSPASLSPESPLRPIPPFHIRPLPAMMTSSPLKTPPRPILTASFMPSRDASVCIIPKVLPVPSQSSNVVASPPGLGHFGAHQVSSPRSDRSSAPSQRVKRIVNGLKIIEETPKDGHRISKRDAPLHPLLTNVPVGPQPGEQRVHLEDFETLKVLGSGAYGTVYLVEKITGRDLGKIYAMKVVKKSTVLYKRKNAEHAVTEREVFEAVRGYSFLSQMHYAFQDELCLYVVLDFLQGGEMFNLLSEKKSFTEDEIRFYVGEMILAIEKLHALGIVYRDIKLENVMLDKQGHVVITDFGLSKKMVDLRTYSYCGTLEYMAPEIVENSGAGHDITVDWWSLAVLMYELFFGESPFVRGFEKRDNSAIARRITDVEYVFPHKISEDAEDLIRRLLAKDASARLGATRGAVELKEHPFFASIDWVKLGNKLVSPPCVNDFNDSMDLANFCDSFTSVELSVSASPPNTQYIWFKGFEYCAPEATVEAVVARSLSSPRVPHISDLVTMKTAGASQFFEKYDVDLTMPPVGRGSSALVFKCWCKSSWNVYAVKILPRYINCANEFRMLARAQKHIGIVQLKELLFDDAFWYIVTEYVEGMDLHTYMKVADFSTCSEQSNRGIMRGVMLAVYHLHCRGMAHRDLKPENIAINLDGKPKLVDFGYACSIKNRNNAAPNFTIRYAAPEVLGALFPTAEGLKRKNLEGVSESPNKRFRGSTSSQFSVPSSESDPRKADMWSIGVMLYLLLSGERLKESIDGLPSSHEVMIRRMHGGELSFSEEGWRHVSPSAISLVKNLLNLNPSKRMTVSEALCHSWMTGVEHQQELSLEHERSEAHNGSPGSANHQRARRGRRRRESQSSSSSSSRVPQVDSSSQLEIDVVGLDDSDAGTTSMESVTAVTGDAFNSSQRWDEESTSLRIVESRGTGLEGESASRTLPRVWRKTPNKQIYKYEPIMTRSRKRKQESPESEVAKVQRLMMLD